ncbi:hypothetical protein Lal_00001065 [Lupinus albus]|nr:hypothetical protein Lal_00001065 [Lupinus albus]
MAVLYFKKMNINSASPKDVNRDRLVLSKGHAAPVLYAALAERGYFPKENLKFLRKFGAMLQGHPDMKLTPGVDISTGSLGQGLSAANGMALAAKLDKKDYKVYVILGDGECQEGQIWEAAMSAAHYKLNNVIAFLDHNGLQIDGTNDEVMSLGSVTDKFKVFGWNVIMIDGHNLAEIEAAIEAACRSQEKPTMIVAKTVKGKGEEWAMNKATRDAYGSALKKLKDNEQVVVLEADLGHATRSLSFKEVCPERFFNMGIAEANMIGTAAVRNSVAYPKLNVKIVGTHAGISVGPDGGTHQCIEDISLMRGIPGMTVIQPADDVEAEAAVLAAAGHDGPVYLRLGRSPSPTIHPVDYQFKIGKGEVLKEGKDVTIIATGLMVVKALEAAKILEQENIHAKVINMSTIKPLDSDLITQAAEDTQRIVTVEEHSVIGGLGNAVSEVLVKNHSVRVRMIGVEDCFWSVRN